MLHPTNIIHLLVLLGVAWLIYRALNQRHSRSQRSAFVLQAVVVVLCVDLVVGLTVIDHWYGSSVSAGWMTKGVIYNAMLSMPLLVAAWRRS